MAMLILRLHSAYARLCLLYCVHYLSCLIFEFREIWSTRYGVCPKLVLRLWSWCLDSRGFAFWTARFRGQLTKVKARCIVFLTAWFHGRLAKVKDSPSWFVWVKDWHELVCTSSGIELNLNEGFGGLFEQSRFFFAALASQLWHQSKAVATIRLASNTTSGANPNW